MDKILQLTCATCETKFERLKKSQDPRSKNYFCTKKCSDIFQCTAITSPCGNCRALVKRTCREFNQSKSGFAFCNRSCAATYNNTHKKYGTRRSKLEVWLEQELQKIYSNIEFIFSGKEAIDSELDIYIPSLSLAFELNGIFHYEPIFSEDKLIQIQNNDNRKMQACLEKHIELCIIDCSKLSYFKLTSAQKYLDIIIKIIDDKVARVGI